jgi:hypothetical protein
LLIDALRLAQRLQFNADEMQILRRSILNPGERLVIVVGNYGSGKTEAAINLALRLADDGGMVQLADLDLVNPYFRCREALELLQAHGIRVVVPRGELIQADLPILLPEVQGMLHPPGETISLFDVGGDEVGSRVLSSLRPGVKEGEYQLWQVINARRPFTDSVEGCLAMQEALELASRMRVTGLLVNTHLIEETTAEVVLAGWQLAGEVSRRNGCPIRCVAIHERLTAEPALRAIDAPVLRIRRTMLPPWLQTSGGLNGTNRV